MTLGELLKASRNRLGMTLDGTARYSVTGPLDWRVGRLEPERADACAHGCNGCDDCTDYEDDGPWCDRCNNDGRDPWTDYLLPCPACQGEQRP